MEQQQQTASKTTGFNSAVSVLPLNVSGSSMFIKRLPNWKKKRKTQICDAYKKSSFLFFFKDFF